MPMFMQKIRALRASRNRILTAVLVLLLGIPFAWAFQEGDDWGDMGGTTGATSKTGTLIVHVEGLESDDGKLRFVMFDSKENFLGNAFRAEIIDIESGQGVWTVDYLPHGVYAVLVHHDLDGNGKMDRHWYGKPKEPTGTSNNPPPRMGPPKWKQASFTFEAPKLTLDIVVR